MPWTIGEIAQAIQAGRSHVSQVLGNKAGRGGQTRRKLARFFVGLDPKGAPRILARLGWDAQGELVRADACKCGRDECGQCSGKGRDV